MLEIRGLTRRYQEGKRREKTVLSPLSLIFPEKGIVAVLGPSGSGKTTLLRLLGLLDEPSDGAILVDGEDTSTWSSAQIDDFRYANVGSVFQDYNLIPHLSVRENIALPFLLRHREDNGRVAEFLARFHLEEVADRLPKEISGGEAQRAAMARAVVLGQKILLCDEPTAALDEENATVIMDCLKEASKDGLVILVSHDDVLAKRYCDYSIRLEKGKLVDSTLPQVTESKPIATRQRARSRLSSVFSISGKRVTRFARQYVMLSLISLVGITAVSLAVSINQGIHSTLAGIETELMQAYPISVDGIYVDLYNVVSSQGKNRYNDDGYLHPTHVESVPYHVNAIGKDYLEYVEKGVSPSALRYLYGSGHPIVTLNQADEPTVFFSGGQEGVTDSLTLSSSPGFGQGAVRPMEMDKAFFLDHYEAIEGRYPEADNEAYLLVSRNGEIDESIAQALGQGGEPFAYAKALERKFAFLEDDSYYVKMETATQVTGKFLLSQEALKAQGKEASDIMAGLSELLSCGESGDIDRGKEIAAELKTYFEEAETSHTLSYFMPVRNPSALTKLYDEVDPSLAVKITGVFRAKPSHATDYVPNGIYFNPTLTTKLQERNQTSEIVAESRYHLSYDPITTFTLPKVYELINSAKSAGASMTETASAIYSYFQTRSKIGAQTTPTSIRIRPSSMREADAVRDYLSAYNKGKVEADCVYFNDLIHVVGASIDTYSQLFYGILAIVISIIAVTCALTVLLTARLEVEKRKREISVFRSIGASRGFVASFFLCEFSWIALFAGVLGVGLSYAFNPLVNLTIRDAVTDFYLDRVAFLPFPWALLIVAAAILVSLASSFVPALLAAWKNPSEHLKD